MNWVLPFLDEQDCQTGPSYFTLASKISFRVKWDWEWMALTISDQGPPVWVRPAPRSTHTSVEVTMECLCSTILVYSYGYNESGGSLLTLGSVRYPVPPTSPRRTRPLTLSE